MECYDNGTFCIVDCGIYLDINSIATLKNILLQAISVKKPLIFHSNEITRIDTAGLQLLLSFTLELKKNNLSWQWEKPSSTLIKTARILGMSKLLKIPNDP